MMNERISDQLTYPSHYVTVHGSKMHYIEAGSGDPILFLHGVPTSCYLWRNIIPHLSTLGRCIAPDLIGFGHSDKPDIQYTVFDHIKYLEGFIEALGLKKITLVMHGWGGVIGFDYAMRHEKNCKGLAFYEAILHALEADEVPLPFYEQMMTLAQDDTDHGHHYVDKMIPQNTMQALSKEAMT